MAIKLHYQGDELKYSGAGLYYFPPVDELSATGVASPAVIGSPSITQVHNLVAVGLVVTPSIDAPSLSQVHNLDAVGLVVSTTLGAPSLSDGAEQPIVKRGSGVSSTPQNKKSNKPRKPIVIQSSKESEFDKIKAVASLLEPKDESDTQLSDSEQVAPVKQASEDTPADIDLISIPSPSATNEREQMEKARLLLEAEIARAKDEDEASALIMIMAVA